MLAVYKVHIDTGRAGLSESSTGLQNGIYRLSTVPLTGYYDCLDGNSFSDISQENMIIKGGELSLAGDVRIKIVSKDIISQILRNDIDLLGCKAAMSAEIGGEEKSVFEGMLISSYSQTDEISFEINLRDSAFANAGQINLKVPQGFGGGRQLESSYGEECLLRLYKRENPGAPISQGIRRSESTGEASISPELEQTSPDGPILTTFDGKPSFARNFVVHRVLNADSGQPAEISVSLERRGPELFGTAGERVEIVSGSGKGNSYRIVSVEKGSDKQEFGGDPCAVVTLDRPVKAGDILGRSDVRSASAGMLPRAKQNLLDTEYPDSIIEQWLTKDSAYNSYDYERSIENISVFRFIGGSDEYAIPLLSGIKPMSFPQSVPNDPWDGFYKEVWKPNAVTINDGGSCADTRIGIKEIEGNEKYCIVEFPKAANGKIGTTESGKHQPRWARKQTSFCSGGDASPQARNIFPADGEQVAVDSKESEPNNLKTVAECSLRQNQLQTEGQGLFGLHAALYWRIDDLRFGEKITVKPMFSFRLSGQPNLLLANLPNSIVPTVQARAFLVDDAGQAIQTKYSGLLTILWDSTASLTRNTISNSQVYLSNDQKAVLKVLKDLLTFDMETAAKYIYLQLYFSLNKFNGNSMSLSFAALPVECTKEAELDKVWLKGFYWGRGTPPYRNIADLTRQLCDDWGVETDAPSFGETAEGIESDMGSSKEHPFIPFSHGENFADKIAEICRAANFSIFSNGSELYAKYFFSGESEWTATPSCVIKDSLEVRNAGLDSVATEWDFSANVRGVQKTLSVETAASFPEDIKWTAASMAFDANLIYKGYMAKGFGAEISSAYLEKLRIGGIYAVKDTAGQFDARCELVSVRVNERGADALFAVNGQVIPAKAFSSDRLRITPLKMEFNWRELVSGTMDAGISFAEDLVTISHAAFEKTKRKNKLDERYSKHKVAAFGADKHWLQSFLKTAAHNSYAKTIISFKVPIDRLPEGSLSSLLLKRITLAFGRFRSSPLNGWIVGYSLAPAEDAVQLEVMNSEPVKDLFFLNENLLDDQLTVDERQPVEEFFSEA